MNGLLGPLGIIINSIGVLANAIGVWKLLQTSPINQRITFDMAGDQKAIDGRNTQMRNAVIKWIIGGCVLQILGNLLQLLA